MNRQIALLCILLAGLTACKKPVVITGSSQIVPLPARMDKKEGVFVFTPSTTFYALEGNEEVLRVANVFAAFLNKTSGYAYKPAYGRPQGKDYVFFQLDPQITHAEGYRLTVRPEGINIAAKTPAGLFYGFQTLRQMLPAAAEKPSGEAVQYAVPAIEIEDAPRFVHRGLMLDVSRHFFPVEFIKKYIDVLALHKMNTFHWHLTDDQGWRIEIKKYPRLTEIGAFRNQTLIGKLGEGAENYDKKRYGGFYTQDEIREVVKYAQERYVTIIPEIEMPGHAQAALASYPHLACTEGPFEVASKWGVSEEVFCPSDTTFQFLEDVLTEVMDLFPSRYIHIGGDECPKKRWEESAFCRQLMKQEGLRDAHELQSYFIRRIERFVNSKGRRIIGWDEILEGGLAPDATVMSWRGIGGGIAAARQKHEVIMSPTSYLYIDYYQANPEKEPLAIGGFLPLEKVYGYEPVPDSLTAEEARYILGAQANLWTEYIADGDYAEYMTYPRASAVAEVVWSPAEQRSWSGFSSRLPALLDRLHIIGVNASPRFYDLKGEALVDSATGKLTVQLSTNNNAAIFYTLDGKEPSSSSTPYAGPVAITQSVIFKAAAFNNGQLQGPLFERNFLVHKASGKKVSYLTPPKAPYTPGPYALVDGVRGSLSLIGDVYTGFEGSDADIVIDLGELTPVKTISVSFLHKPSDWIFMPAEVRFSVSADGKSYTNLGERPNPDAAEEGSDTQLRISSVTVEPVEARYVRVTARSIGKLPAWHAGAGNKGWLFADEIVVD
ncbi:MAG: beta-N-acetylhexosaminidase [Bacteroidetes bacterium]|nr:MAG: beta-N-acetylhexosaminidase [Bacteroidota bacterium]